MKARILRILSCQEPDMWTIFSRVSWQIVRVICNMFHTHLYLKQIQTLWIIKGLVPRKCRMTITLSWCNSPTFNLACGFPDGHFLVLKCMSSKEIFNPPVYPSVNRSRKGRRVKKFQSLKPNRKFYRIYTESFHATNFFQSADFSCVFKARLHHLVGEVVAVLPVMQQTQRGRQPNKPWVFMLRFSVTNF